MNNQVRDVLGSNNPEVFIPTVREASGNVKYLIDDNQLIKDLINSSFMVSAYGTNTTIKQGGWEGLIDGGNLNEKLLQLLQNPAIFLYTQILIIEVVALLSEEKEHVADSNNPTT